MTPPIVTTQSLTKRFGSFTALSNCSLSINSGEVFGLLGPNGAGKSTLIRLMMGFINPSEGLATISGLDCLRQRVEVHRIVSYLPGDARLYRMMRGLGVLKLFTSFNGVRPTLIVVERIGHQSNSKLQQSLEWPALSILRPFLFLG